VELEMMRSRLYELLATAIVVSTIGCASHDSSNGLGDPKVVAKLHDLGLELSSIAGVPEPTTMYAVEVSDHQTAEKAVSGDIVDDDYAPAYVIVMTGGPFTALEAPAGATPPEGSVLTATVNAATYEATDVGISNVEPDLSQVALATADLNAD
jgi:hypothetical protein